MIDMIKLANMSTLMQYKADEVIISPAPSDGYCMYFVLAGSAVEYDNYGTKQQSMVKEHGYGAMFGETSMFMNVPSPTTVVARENITLISINRNNFTSICQNNPDGAFDIIADICGRMVAAEKNSSHLERIAGVAMKKLGTTIKEFSNQLLFPSEHKVPDQKEPDSFHAFLSPYKVKCPHCSAEFETRTILSSKLRPLSTVQQRADLRQRYIDFDTTWYDIVSCPHCCYSAQMVYFTKHSSIAKNAYSEKLAEIKASVNPSFTYPKTLEQVFASYYIALVCAEGFENPSQSKGRLWLQLSWLYEDLNQQEMLKIARKTAYDCYLDFYGTSVLDSVSTQVCCLYLGFLAGRLDEYERAMEFLYKAKSISDGKPVYKMIAEREADAIRDEHKGKK